MWALGLFVACNHGLIFINLLQQYQNEMCLLLYRLPQNSVTYLTNAPWVVDCTVYGCTVSKKHYKTFGFITNYAIVTDFMQGTDKSFFGRKVAESIFLAECPKIDVILINLFIFSFIYFLLTFAFYGVLHNPESILIAEAFSREQQNLIKRAQVNTSIKHLRHSELPTQN